MRIIIALLFATALLAQPPAVKVGYGDPNNRVSGVIGDIYQRQDGGANTTLYVKEANSGTNFGWVAAASSSGAVTSLTGTANQITVSSATGAVTLSIPTNPTLPGNTTGTFIGNVTGNVSGTAATFTGALTGDVTSSAMTTTIAANAVTAAKSAVVLTRRVCSIVVGADNAALALVDADIGPQGQQCKIPFAATVVEIDVNADAGTPSVIVRKKHCASFTTGVCDTWTSTDLLSGALAAAASNFDACSKTTAVTGLDGGTTCSGTLQNTSLAAGDWIELTSGTAGGVAKRLSVDILYLVN